MRYIGLDLAWGDKNPTGGVVLDGLGDPKSGATLVAMANNLGTDADILDFVRAHDDSGGGLLIGIDAPLLVPNESGKRPCETILSACLRKPEAGPHPANRTLLSNANGEVRGERLTALLVASLNLTHTPYLDGLPVPPRAVFEVFPHPAHVALFGLTKTLKYKARPKRTMETRLAEFRRYAQFLETLRHADPPLFLPPGNDFWLRRDPAGLSRPLSRLKAHEDTLDALTCAYIALYRYRWNDAKCPVVGDLATGYIVTPASDEMRACFASHKNIPSPVETFLDT